MSRITFPFIVEARDHEDGTNNYPSTHYLSEMDARKKFDELNSAGWLRIRILHHGETIALVNAPQFEDLDWDTPLRKPQSQQRWSPPRADQVDPREDPSLTPMQRGAARASRNPDAY